MHGYKTVATSQEKPQEPNHVYNFSQLINGLPADVYFMNENKY